MMKMAMVLMIDVVAVVMVVVGDEGVVENERILLETINLAGLQHVHDAATD